MHNHSLKRIYSANDRMLRHKILDKCFLMITFFSTKNLRSHREAATVANYLRQTKFLYAFFPMKSKSKVILDLKQFEKEIMSLGSMITETSREDKYQELNSFFT